MPSGTRVASATTSDPFQLRRRSLAPCLILCALLSLPSASSAASKLPSLSRTLEECAKFGRRVKTCRGEFRIDSRLFREVQDGRMPPTTTTGSWEMSGSGLREETTRTYPALAAGTSTAQSSRGGRRSGSRTAPATPPHGEERRVVVFDGATCRVQEYKGGVRQADRVETGGDAAQVAAGHCEFWKYLGITPPGVRSGAQGLCPVDDGSGSLEMLGVESLDGVDCLKLRSRAHAGDREVLWWVAPAYGYLVMRKDEIRYFEPGQELKQGQYTLVRIRVTEVERFPSSAYLPTRVQKSAVWMNSDGSIARQLRRWTFTASDMTVNDSAGTRVYSAAQPAG